MNSSNETPSVDPVIDIDVGSNALGVLLTHVENCWRQLGDTEPHWSVLTETRFKANQISENAGDFYASGAGDFTQFSDAARRCGVKLPLHGTCLELGCGVGRVTSWLARNFRYVIGADVSPSHLAIARKAAIDCSWSNVELRLVDRIEAIDGLPRFESFFSMIVLQHNPPPVIHWLLRIMLTKLKVGGIGFFQVPTFLPNYKFDAAAYLADPPTHGDMEMHALPLSVILTLIEQTGCELLEAREYNCTGIPDAMSHNFLVRKSFRATAKALLQKFFCALKKAKWHFLTLGN